MRGTVSLAFLCISTGFTVSADAQSSGGAGQFTLVSSSLDPNGLMLNPRWRTSEDPLSLDPAKKCGLFGVGGGAGYRPVVVRDTGCFDAGQRNLLRLNEPRRVVRLGGAICGQSLSDGWPQGHLNWFPVTMTGVAVFTDGLKGKGGDFDFNFELFATEDRPMPITKWNRKDKKRYRELMGRDRQSIHTEVDYRETFMRIAGPGNTWWEDFRDRALRDIAEADALFKAGEAVVTGLFNLDLVHWGHSEIHPIYAMALLVKSDTTSATSIRERWAFFARDRGNEGNCATGVMPFLRATDSTGYQPFRINIRAPAGASGVPTINRGERASWIGATSAVRGPVFRAAPNQGLQIEVEWRAPHPDSLDALVAGTLDVTWRGNFGGTAVDARQAQVSQLQRVLATVDKSSLGPEGAEGKTVGHSDKAETPRTLLRVSEPDELYYDTLASRRVTALPNWSSEVKLVTDLPSAPGYEPVATVIYDLWPPVLSCAQVRASQNPRCRGDRAFVAFSGFGVKDWAQSSFNGKVGLGVESPRLEFAGRNLMLRVDLEYSARRFGPTDGLRTSHRLGVHPSLVARAPFFSGIYAIARPGAGVQWQSGTRDGYWSLAAGLGTSPRTGQVVNVSVETLYGISSNRRPAIEAVVRFAYVP
jgi:hypothetical protein